MKGEITFTAAKKNSYLYSTGDSRHVQREYKTDT